MNLEEIAELLKDTPVEYMACRLDSLPRDYISKISELAKQFFMSEITCLRLGLSYGRNFERKNPFNEVKNHYAAYLYLESNKNERRIEILTNHQ